LIELAVAKLGAPGSATNAGEDVQSRRTWMRRMAEADAQEGLVKDAMRDYQASLIGWSKSLLKIPGARAETAEAKSYYLAHGGTEEQWPVWATTATATTIYRGPAAELSFPSRLPEFSAVDLQGREWSLGSLQGKATLVVFWATWCGPCRGEHPGIQEMYEKTKGRKDVQVLTISVDEDAGAARRYMDENKYSFPVVWAPQLADQLFPYEGLPTSFLVNPDGARTGMYPIGSDSVEMGRLIEKLGGIVKGK
jgi:thiol-disulfide isomerase/thioredoxin